MSENFGLKMGLEGEREFKKSLAEINNSFKVLGSEMKLVDSQFDKNDKSTEALTARSEVLNKEIDSQKQKIETLRSALTNAAESFGENDRRTQSWQIQLNNAQAALNGICQRQPCRKGGLPDMPGFQLTAMSSSQAMKHRWTTTLDTFSQSRNGNS